MKDDKAMGDAVQFLIERSKQTIEQELIAIRALLLFHSQAADPPSVDEMMVVVGKLTTVVERLKWLMMR